jgi:hypothetical protein
MAGQEWLNTTQACKALGLTPYKLRERLKENGVERYQLKSFDKRSWYIKAVDVERIRKALAHAASESELKAS